MKILISYKMLTDGSWIKLSLVYKLILLNKLLRRKYPNRQSCINPSFIEYLLKYTTDTSMETPYDIIISGLFSLYETDYKVYFYGTDYNKLDVVRTEFTVNDRIKRFIEEL